MTLPVAIATNFQPCKVGGINLKDFSNYQFRCSALHKIIKPTYTKQTKPALTEKQKDDFLNLETKERTKAQEEKYQYLVSKIEKAAEQEQKLETGTISELHKIWAKEVLEIEQELLSNAVRRGIEQEEDSIKLLNEVGNTKVSKNQETFSKGYLCGTPDILTEKAVLDVKTCENWFSFDKSTAESSQSDHAWQLWGYQQLTGKGEAYIVRTLPSYPTDAIEIIASRYPENCEDKVFGFYNYDRIPANKRVKMFKVDTSFISETKVKEIADKCRAYLNMLNHKFINQKVYEQN